MRKMLLVLILVLVAGKVIGADMNDNIRLYRQVLPYYYRGLLSVSVIQGTSNEGIDERTKKTYREALFSMRPQGDNYLSDLPQLLSEYKKMERKFPFLSALPKEVQQSAEEVAEKQIRIIYRAVDAARAKEAGKSGFEYLVNAAGNEEFIRVFNYVTYPDNKDAQNMDARLMKGQFNENDIRRLITLAEQRVKEYERQFRVAGGTNIVNPSTSGKSVGTTTTPPYIWREDSEKAIRRREAEAMAAQAKMARLESAAAMDDAHALMELGILYYEGKDVLQDHVSALNYFTRAVDKGGANANRYLGGVGQALQPAPNPEPDVQVSKYPARQNYLWLCRSSFVFS